MVFNPQANYDRTPDTLNLSRGYKTGAGAAGESLSQLAGVVDSKIKSTDRALAQLATDETRMAVEQTDAELFGVGPATAPSADPLDKEVRGQVRNLAAKKQAMENGAISPEHYYATTQARVKEIRTRYAGYNEQIDDELRRMGLDPNWQRKQIMEAADEARRAAASRISEQDRNAREFIERTLTSVPMSPEEAGLLIQEGSYRDPRVVRLAKLRTAQHVARKNDYESRRLELEVEEGTDKAKSRVAGNLYHSELQTELASVLTKGVSFKGLQEGLGRANQAIARGEKPTVEQLEALKGQLGVVRAEMERVKLDTRSRYTNTGLDPAQIKAAEEVFDKTLDGIAEGIENPSSGLLAYHKASLERFMAGYQGDVLKSSEELKTLAAARELLGENATAVILTNNMEKAKSAGDKLFRDAAAISTVTNKYRSIREVLTKGGKPPEFDGAATKEFLNDMLSVADNPNTRTEGRLSVLRMFYTEDNKQLWDTMFDSKSLSEDEQQMYYKRLTSPSVVKLLRETGDVNLINSYSDTVTYLTTKMNRATANDLMSIRTTSTSSDIQWDAAKNRFKLVKRSDPTVNPTYRFLNKIGAKVSEITGTEQQVVNRINSSLEAVMSTADMLGIDKNQAARQFLNATGIQLDAPKAGGFFEQLDNKANEQINKNKRGKDGISGGGGRDNAGGGPAGDTLKDPGSITSRTPTTRERVMDALTGLNLPPELADKIGSAVEFAVGPLDTPSEVALGALSVVPGGRVAGMAKTAGQASVRLVEGTIKKAEDLVKNLPNLSEMQLIEGMSEIDDILLTEKLSDAARGTLETASAKLSSKLETIAPLEVPKGWQDAVDEVAKQGPLTAERWAAESAKATATAKGNVVSLNDVRAAREAMKVADDLDADAVKFVTKAISTTAKRDKQVYRLATSVEKNAERWMRIGNDLLTKDNNPEVHGVLQSMLKNFEQYARLAKQQQENVQLINKHGRTKALGKVFNNNEEMQSKLAEEIMEQYDILDGWSTPLQVK